MSSLTPPAKPETVSAKIENYIEFLILQLMMANEIVTHKSEAYADKIIYAGNKTFHQKRTYTAHWNYKNALH